MKTANEDHKLRSITKERITDLGSIDFEVQLAFPPSMVRDRLRDSQQSIETLLHGGL